MCTSAATSLPIMQALLAALMHAKRFESSTGQVTCHASVCGPVIEALLNEAASDHQFNI